MRGCTLCDTKLKTKLLDNNYKHSVQRRRSLPRKGICKAPYTNEHMPSSWTRYVLHAGGRFRSWDRWEEYERKAEEVSCVTGTVLKAYIDVVVDDDDYCNLFGVIVL